MKGHAGPAEDAETTTVCVFHTVQLYTQPCHPPTTTPIPLSLPHTHIHTCVSHSSHIKDWSSGSVSIHTFVIVLVHVMRTKVFFFRFTLKWRQRLINCVFWFDLFWLWVLTHGSKKCFVISMGAFSFLQKDTFHPDRTCTFAHDLHLVTEVTSPDTGDKYT